MLADHRQLGRLLLQRRYSCALLMASADWLANVCRNSQVSSSTTPGVRLRTTSAPMIRSSRSIGTATRLPPSRVAQRAEVRIVCPQGKVRHLQRGPALAARPMNVSWSPSRIPRKLEHLVLVPKAVRTRNSSDSVSNSRIEPPSVSDRRTALVTIAVRTSSRSRLELTASPSRQSLELLHLRASSCCPGLQRPARPAVRTATAACAAKSSAALHPDR